MIHTCYNNQEGNPKYVYTLPKLIENSKSKTILFEQTCCITLGGKTWVPVYVSAYKTKENCKKFM